ncbi:MAG: ArsR family transcriptional regulator [Candidatus Binatus sp.]|nr:ArsR family transcriptional regulator [Candidatus Binatus sp.]
MKREEVIAALGALAQESRLDIFRMLVEKGPDGVPAGEIAHKLKLPAPTLSFHLGQLKHAGLLNARRNSRSIAYAANYETMNALLRFLTENCCGGRPELCAPTIACAPVNGKRARRSAAMKKKTNNQEVLR